MHRFLVFLGSFALILGYSSCSIAQKASKMTLLEERVSELEKENRVLQQDVKTLQLQMRQLLDNLPEQDLSSGGSTEGNGETQIPADATTVRFDSDRHDFGVIKQQDKVSYVYTFTNTGTQPLNIRDVKASCGCTIPKWPKKPIPPGKTGEIKIVFTAAGKSGPQHKVVTVTANTVPANTRLYLQAYIEQ